MQLKPCPHCDGKEFEKVPGNYGLIQMDDHALNEVGVFGKHTNMLPLSLEICKKCEHIAITYNKNVQ